MNHLFTEILVEEYLRKEGDSLLLNHYKMVFPYTNSIVLKKINQISKSYLKSINSLDTINFDKPNRVFVVIYDTHRGIDVPIVLETDSNANMKCKCAPICSCDFITFR